MPSGYFEQQYEPSPSGSTGSPGMFSLYAFIHMHPGFELQVPHSFMHSLILDAHKKVPESPNLSDCIF